jgi:hypothetical protein
MFRESYPENSPQLMPAWRSASFSLSGFLVKILIRGLRDGSDFQGVNNRLKVVVDGLKPNLSDHLDPHVRMPQRVRGNNRHPRALAGELDAYVNALLLNGVPSVPGETSADPAEVNSPPPPAAARFQESELLLEVNPRILL